MNKKKPVTQFALSATVPLSGWQALSSYPLATTKTVLSGRYYQFRKKNLSLGIKMHYMDNANYEDIRTIIRQNTNKQVYSSSQSIIVRHQQGIGFYGLYSNTQQSALSSCINARGNTTVTPSQFHHNRWQYDIDPARIALWLIGRREIWDHRRLCVYLSIPLTHSTSEEANRILESAWLSWYAWWRHKFLGEMASK
ncbi:MAG: cyanoexosortase A system-associated protein [Acaryochloris sp. RU_4_1]|nr:cyanoexosortase A system-associated protein [Acaryochloris sp. RU_4_1]NJR56157.1 cyanoexosortase A system-associated protein [Acaryochloris sp. CRU_2_0]